MCATKNVKNTAAHLRQLRTIIGNSIGAQAVANCVMSLIDSGLPACRLATRFHLIAV